MHDLYEKSLNFHTSNFESIFEQLSVPPMRSGGRDGLCNFWILQLITKAGAVVTGLQITAFLQAILSPAHAPLSRIWLSLASGEGSKAFPPSWLWGYQYIYQISLLCRHRCSLDLLLIRGREMWRHKQKFHDKWTLMNLADCCLTFKMNRLHKQIRVVVFF